MVQKLFEEQTIKGFVFVSSSGFILTNRCNNCNFEFKYDPRTKQKLICPSCGNV
ncbi:MAG TPA: hypothetical protein HA224_03730 [Nanoarchaeota archaeon]|nr:hypothetical protein [Nanoarchaeota archaeon]